MAIIAGVDIGNSTTEICLGSYRNKELQFLGSSEVKTTGTKGTLENVHGVLHALKKVLHQLNLKTEDLDVIRLNEAAPVIGDSAMETITETVITESTMVGHNPDTPAGVGLAVGYTVDILDLDKSAIDRDYLVLVNEMDYEKVACKINDLTKKGYRINGAILKNDEAVLVSNRLTHMIPIIDEVKGLHKIPINMLGAIEVATEERTIKMLSNPYGIATIFKLDQEATRLIIPIAKSLVGNRSAVVIRTPEGKVAERSIPAGKIRLMTENKSSVIDVDHGAEMIMEAVNGLNELLDVNGEENTNVGNMFSRMKSGMAKLTNKKVKDIHVKDLLALDTILPITVQGGIAGEVAMEKAVAMAAMVKTDYLPMEQIATAIKETTGIHTEVAGIEAVMASIGALTTPGTGLPQTILDLGGGSTDIAYLNQEGKVLSEHFAGAGQMVTMLINSELGLGDLYLAENIKRYPVAKVESLFHIRLENGTVKFFDHPFSPHLFGKLVVLEENNMIPINQSLTMDKIIHIRKEAKKKVFITNVLRGLKKLVQEDLQPHHIVLVGGSTLDFEIPGLILEALSSKGYVVGSGNIRGRCGPRNAVATGLVLSYKNDSEEE
ncbi:diol dehydratase reactivase subunit alpha [Vallitalea okinawensis]|uniref:diol dehydratase reactivase subunit alpha n=1 Tax=Vallitalea okinawensis TaxID=2078660 RepID=UPI000CFD4723|nr:diol dehydratase reactivase subunit alpha [Vallitalea okinawensis]